MSLGTDILDAVQRGGLNNWKATTQMPIHAKQRMNRKTEATMRRVLDSIKGVMTSSEIATSSRCSPDATYKCLVRLLHAGKIVRSTRGQPYTYWKK